MPQMNPTIAGKLPLTTRTMLKKLALWITGQFQSTDKPARMTANDAPRLAYLWRDTFEFVHVFWAGAGVHFSLSYLCKPAALFAGVLSRKLGRTDWHSKTPLQAVAQIWWFDFERTALYSTAEN
jgi:hypothetical protein